MSLAYLRNTSLERQNTKGAEYFMKKFYVAITTALITFGTAISVLAESSHWH